jgi:hypothetical protein
MADSVYPQWVLTPMGIPMGVRWQRGRGIAVNGTVVASETLIATQIDIAADAAGWRQIQATLEAKMKKWRMTCRLGRQYNRMSVLAVWRAAEWYADTRKGKRL